MKVLYAIQGTGNGHVSRAMEIIPILKRYAQTDVLLSGIQADLHLPFPVTYQYKGMSFIFGKKGGVDLYKTCQLLDTKLLRKNINEVPVEKYDLVINDFEPITAWACKSKDVPCIALSHQSAILAPEAPKPKSIDFKGYLALKYYAPATYSFGLHFDRYTDSTFTPVIRKEVRKSTVTNKGHYTVYLPAYSEEKLIKNLTKFPTIKWEVFSKHSSKRKIVENITLNPVNNQTFLESMASSSGVLCGAGFETPAEALFLGKKLLVIPMKNQFEQQCNAEALRLMGVDVVKKLNKKNLITIWDWLESRETINVDYPDVTEKIIINLLDNFKSITPGRKNYTPLGA